MSTRAIDHLLIGGGLACATAAETLRELAPNATIAIVGRESDPPYDRPPCSKGYLAGTEGRQDSYVHPEQWYEQQGIELHLRTSVMALDGEAQVAKLSNKEQIAFGRALLAPGAHVRRLQVPGAELEGIHYLRTLGNADAIRADLEQAEHVVMIGGSYIGTEVAATLSASGRHCSIVMMETVPLEHTVGRRIGGHFASLLSEHDIAVHGDQELDSFQGDGRVRRVLTKAGLELPADLVVIGAGVMPEVRLARAAGLTLGARSGILCDAQLQTSAAGIYAAGDACEYFSNPHGRHLLVEHWDAAAEQGRTAARNMAGQPGAHEVLPYFFSDLADWCSLEYVGPAYEWDQEILCGEPADGDFTMWYLQGERLAAALTVGRSADLDTARMLIASGRQLSAAERQALADGQLVR